MFAHSQANLPPPTCLAQKPAQSAVYRDPFTTHHSRSRLAEIAASRTGELVEPPTTTTSASAEAVDPCTRRPFDWLSRQFCFAGRLYCEAETCHWQYPSLIYRYTRRPLFAFSPAASTMVNAACIHLRHALRLRHPSTRHCPLENTRLLLDGIGRIHNVILSTRTQYWQRVVVLFRQFAAEYTSPVENNQFNTPCLHKHYIASSFLGTLRQCRPVASTCILAQNMPSLGSSDVKKYRDSMSFASWSPATSLKFVVV